MPDTIPPPPPPPENPFMSGNGEEHTISEQLDQGTPNVAAKPGRMLAVVGIVGVVLLLLLYTIFSGGKKEVSTKQEKPRPVASSTLEPPPLPPNPALLNPPTIAPPVAIMPPSIPQAANMEVLKPADNGAAQKQALERLRSKMMLADGGGGGAPSTVTTDKVNKPAPTANDPTGNSAFEAGVVNANAKADTVEATQIKDLRHTIAQGRIIQATMESAMNTDLPAPVRAIVSRDTYAEAGMEPLIPKGSRLIGTYNTDISGGQSRVFVVWTRVIRPDGIDVMINSPLVDQIGQAGAGGQVDTKFQAIFSRSVLSSIVSIAFAIGSDKLSGGTSTTTTNGSGTTTTGDAATTATVNALNRLGATTDAFISNFVDTRPTILVDQGTPVNVFVNRDLIFPPNLTSTGAKIVN